jgi:hypothetical protein
MNELTNTKNYQTFLKEIKEQIRTSQTRAISSVNSEMIILYYREYSDITFMPQAVAQIEQLIFSIPWGN